MMILSIWIKQTVKSVDYKIFFVVDVQPSVLYMKVALFRQWENGIPDPPPLPSDRPEGKHPFIPDPIRSPN